MLIKDLFAKAIDRDIKGVVKVGQDDLTVIKQELEEYVVTNELQKHFRDFFSSYKRGINTHTDKIGVWISGFFGSGKSHFLKILSYLLENKVVDNKRAIDYFLEDEKIKNPMVIADMDLASSVSTDVILFNIDSKSETSGKKDKDGILNVFLKVFNEKLGYSTNPHVADLERQLIEEKAYEDFRDHYKEITGEEWEGSRHKFNFFKDKVAKALAESGFMSLDTANDWARTTVKPYQISIDRFCQMINDYINQKGADHHIVFLVDEMGQYIGDNTDLMLNLQTITEDLGTLCQGRAWIIVTSQQDIDAITEVKGRDFSKIQGRFDTRLSLTSANVDEVIKLRILEKNETAKQTLAVLYENKETIIKNLIIFNDGIEKKLYEDKNDFCQVYPFIPYQFNILAGVLTSIRKHGASGKHLSEGERSMLALFKESAEKLMEDSVGAIVPFNIFYGALNKFLDHSHSVVVARALDNKLINPDGEEDNFTVNVFKTLFMIKYVKEIHANLDNITTLMVANIDDDRRLLKDRVEAALDTLVKQMLVQKSGDIYIFLTDEEQEINREIENQEIQSIQVGKKVAELIFADLFPEEKIRAPGFKNRYAFAYNRFVDDHPYKANQAFDFGVRVVTPYSHLSRQEGSLRMQSGTGQDVYVDLPSDAEFLNELRLAMKIEKFLNSPGAGNIPKFEEIRAIKGAEMKKHEDRSKLFLQEALKEASFYVNGDCLPLAGRDFKYNLNESLERLIATVYHKLSYLTSPMDQGDIYKLLKEESSGQISLAGQASPNENAIREILDFIRMKTRNHTKISLKEIENRFSKAPYGFLESDMAWMIAKCFKDGLISLTLNGNTVSLVNQGAEKIVDYLTKRAYVEKLLIEEKEMVPEIMKRSLKLVAKEVFKTTISTDDSDAMAIHFNHLALQMVEELKRSLLAYQLGHYPGKSIIEDGRQLIQMTTAMDKEKDVFAYIREHEDDYLDFSESYPQVKSFLAGQQKIIWETSQGHLALYEDSKSFVVNDEIEEIVKKIREILKMANPYNLISQLPDLNHGFSTIYQQILADQVGPVKAAIDHAQENVQAALKNSNLEESLTSRFDFAFSNLLDKAKSCNNIAQVNGFIVEAQALETRFLNDIKKEKENRAKEKDDGQASGTLVKELKIHKSIRMKDLSKSWQIETKNDIEKYLQALKEELESHIEDNIILNIEF